MVPKLKSWCRHSLTIAWARLQVAAGIVLVVAAEAVEILQAANAQALVPPRWNGLVLVAMGIITETARRRKEWQR